MTHSQKWLCHLERDVLVGDFGAGTGGRGLVVGASCSCVEVVGAARCASASGSCAGAGCGAVSASAEHAEIARDDFKTGALLTLFVLPLPRLNASLDEN